MLLIIGVCWCCNVDFLRIKFAETIWIIWELTNDKRKHTNVISDATCIKAIRMFFSDWEDVHDCEDVQSWHI